MKILSVGINAINKQAQVPQLILTITSLFFVMYSNQQHLLDVQAC